MNPFVSLAQDNDMAINMGKGKMFPQGPEFIFNGKMVPMFCCCSDNGSITSELVIKKCYHILMSVKQLTNLMDFLPFCFLMDMGATLRLSF